MGWTSENVAQDYNVSRERQDHFAFISHTRASEALKKGIFAEEILPIEIKGQIVSVDDTIRPGVTAEGLASLKSAFPQWQPGTTTAGNASGVGDGAGLVMMATRERAEKEGMEILGKWVGSTVVGEPNLPRNIFDAFKSTPRCRATIYGHLTGLCRSQDARAGWSAKRGHRCL